MKIAILFATLMIILSSCVRTPLTQSNAQAEWGLPFENGMVKYDLHLRNTNTKSANTALAYKWVAQNYRSAKTVIQAYDKDAGIVVVVGTYPMIWDAGIGGNIKVNVSHNLTFLCSDSLIDVSLSDFNCNYYVSGTQYTAGTFVDEPLERWVTWRSSSKKVFIDNQFKPKINELAGRINLIK